MNPKQQLQDSVDEFFTSVKDLFDIGRDFIQEAIEAFEDESAKIIENAKKSPEELKKEYMEACEQAWENTFNI